MMRSMTQTRAAHPRGRPLAMLVVILLAWTITRIAMWETPWPKLNAIAPTLLAGGSSAPESQADSVAPANTPSQSSGTNAWQGYAPLPPGASVPVEGLSPAQPVHPMGLNGSHSSYVMIDGGTPSGHQAMWLAAMSHMPVPVFADHSWVGATLPRHQQPEGQSDPDRWSVDAWAFWRQGSDAALASQGRAPTYGASQAGAVLNYRLAPSAKRDPRAYVRVYRALIDGGESELAAGLSARPVAKLPIRAHAELRATERGGGNGTDMRASAFVTTELAPVQLPLGARAEIYAQAGYVGGKDATAFADGQLHILRDLAEFDLADAKPAQFSVGAAAWGGAQEGAQRVDVGPSVRVDLTIGAVPTRLSVDYRERVAGSAEPDSGAAVTLSTRF